ncbi:hypothetical protein HKX48_005493 [Thoreauomyces humboldtii]|nr:hypothetical protein HKX48_005493 [Thoreauomyces humboldtii]
MVHNSRPSPQNKGDRLGASGPSYGFAGPVAGPDAAGRTLIYTGALNTWFHNFRLAAGIFTAVPLAGVPWIHANSVIPLEQTIGIVALAGTLPWLALHILSGNYVTTLMKLPSQPNDQQLLLTTQSLFGRVREYKVATRDLRYSPSWVNRVWRTATPIEHGFFVDPKVMRSDPVLGKLWMQVIRQSEPVVKGSWFHKLTPEEIAAQKGNVKV